MNTFLHYLNLKQFIATAATLALVVPAVKAESVWLIMHASRVGGLEKIEMGSMDQCLRSANKFKTSDNITTGQDVRGWECLEGK